MTPNPVKRKLAAILSADAVSYSRLMAADEEVTMKILAAHRAVIDGIIQFHEGRIVNTAGDSVLAEFASPVEAVRSAVEIQDALKTRNDSLVESRRMQFRIGVNLGDVMIKGDDLLGDGVNVAARLQGLAEPGNIYVSSSVYDQIAGKLDLGFVDLGAQSLKNIDRPIRAYRIEREGRHAPAPTKPGRTKGIWIGLALAGAVVAAVYLGYPGWLSVQKPAADERARAETELAKARAEVEAGKQRAEAEVELARARAEVEAAKRHAETEMAAAAQARRALEDQRAADARARAQAEAAGIRAEAEAARRKAEQELAAAEKARRAAEDAAMAGPKPSLPAEVAPSRAPPGVPRRFQGPWVATIACPPIQTRPAADFSIPFSVTDDVFELQYRERGKPGSIRLTGVPRPDGTLQLSGGGVSPLKSSYGSAYPARFNATLKGTRFEGGGQLGGRKCTLLIERR